MGENSIITNAYYNTYNPWDVQPTTFSYSELVEIEHLVHPEYLPRLRNLIGEIAFWFQGRKIVFESC